MIASLLTLSVLTAVWVLKQLLDIHLMHYVVRYLAWVPTRGVFRQSVYDVSGVWWQEWLGDSPRFPDLRDKRSRAVMYQFFIYCLADFEAGDRHYRLFGRIVANEHLVGDWFDPSDTRGYYGSFQLTLSGKQEMRGMWMGHSKATRAIQVGEWRWDRVEHPAA